MTTRLLGAAVAAVLVLALLPTVGQRTASASTGDTSAGLALPFAPGQTWTLLGGPHDWNGTPDPSPVSEWNSLDLSCPTITATCNGTVLAPRAGVVHFDTCGPGNNYLRIDHLDGWDTTYYHLLNIQVSEGQTVGRGQPLGSIGQGTGCGGSAGPAAHVHFSLWYAPSGFSLDSDLAEDPEQHGWDGVDVGGWTVHAGSAQYDGCMVRDWDGTTQCSTDYGGSGQIYNEGVVGGGVGLAPGNLLSSASFEGGHEDGWYTSALNHATYNLRDSVHYPQEGSWFLEVNAIQAGAYYAQNVAIGPQPSESYTFSAWLRSPTGQPVQACLDLIAAGGPDESVPLCLAVSTTSWTQYTVPLDVHQLGHSGLIAALYDYTPNVTLDMDGTRLLSSTLQSASFEGGREDGWISSGMNHAVYSTRDSVRYPKEGNSFLELSGAQAGSPYYAQRLPVVPQPEESFTFSAWLRSPTGQAVPTCMYFVAEGGPDESTPLCINVSSTTWTRYAVPLDIHQPGHVDLVAGWYIYTPGVPLDVDGAGVANAGLTSASFEAHHEDRWITSGMYHEVYNVNDGFHFPAEGSWFLEVNAYQTGSPYYAQRIPLTPLPGESYNFSAWLRSPTGQPVATCMYLIAEGGADESTPLCVNVSSTAWTRYSVPIDIHQGGHTDLVMGWYVYTTGVIFDIDGVSLESIPASGLLVRQTYADLLGRPADEAGLLNWSALIDGGMPRAEMGAGFVRSAEYRSRAVSALYLHYLQRPADPAGLQGWVNDLGAGATYEQVIAGLTGSDEYWNLHGGGLGFATHVDTFVRAIYSDVLGRQGDAGGISYWDQQIMAGAPRYAITNAFTVSTEYYQLLVSTDYQVLLRRPADSGGLGYWVGAFQQGVRDEAMIVSFVSSDEYLQYAVVHK